jgi:hypothetical protein
MSYERKIAHLEETHAMLERELAKAEMNRWSTYLINEIKKKKLHAKDLIMELKKLDSHGKEFQ